MVQQRRIAAGVVALPVLEAGAGGRPLLLLHGFTGAGTDFADHLDALAEAGFHAVAPTQRGHLDSAAPPDEADYSLDRFAIDALALADALGWARFTLLGHSMGGMVAQVLVLTAPERVESLVLMDTCPGPVAIDPVTANGAAQLVRAEGMDALADAMAALGPGPLETPAAARLRETRPELDELNDRKLRGSAAPMYAAMATEMLAQDDRLGALRTLDLPTLVVVGELDAPFRAASERLAEAIPGALLEVVADAGHSPQVEAPEAWAKVVLGFLAGT